MRRKKNNNPFSLFAFQDIITSVSGIFIFLTLLLALELVNRVAKISQITITERPRQSLEQLKSEITVLRSQIENVQKKIVGEIQAQEGILSLSETEITANTIQLNSDIDTVQKETDALEVRHHSLEDQCKNLPQKQEDLSRLQQEIKTLQEQNSDVREKLEQLEEGHLNIYTRSAKYKEKPWIIDISAKRIEIISLTKEERVVLANKEMFLEWTGQRNRQNDYFFLVFRPSASGFAIELQEQLKLAGFKLGLELMGENEEIVILGK